MKTSLAAAAAGLLVTATACAAPPATHKKPAVVSGVVTSKTSTQAVAGGACTRAPAPAECAPRWTIAYRDKAGTTHLATVTEAAFNRYKLGDRYPADTKQGKGGDHK